MEHLSQTLGVTGAGVSFPSGEELFLSALLARRRVSDASVADRSTRASHTSPYLGCVQAFGFIRRCLYLQSNRRRIVNVSKKAFSSCFDLGREGMAKNTALSNACGTSLHKAAIWSSVQARSVISSLYDLIQIAPRTISE